MEIGKGEGWGVLVASIRNSSANSVNQIHGIGRGVPNG